MSESIAAFDPAVDAAEHHHPVYDYDSGPPVERGKFAIWLFLATEIMFFGGLIGAYIVLRTFSSSPDYVMVEYEDYPFRTVYAERNSSASKAGYYGYISSSRNKKRLGVIVRSDSSAPWATHFFLPLEAIELHLRKRL